MTVVDAVVEAFRLFVLTVGFTIDEAKRAEARKDAATTKRAIFEAAVARALEKMRADATREKRQIDTVDDEIDRNS